MTRQRVVLAIRTLAFLLAAYLGWAGYARWFDDPVRYHRLVGRTESEIRRWYGSPDRDWPGYAPLAMDVPPSLPDVPLRTLVFHPRGLFHPEGGTYWVWLADRDGEWVCFQSTWFADTVRF